MLTLFCVLAFLLTLQGLVSLREGFVYRGYVKSSLAQPIADYRPSVTIIAPCKGIDPGFRDNIRALFEQDYKPANGLAFDIIFVVESDQDPAVTQLTSIIGEMKRNAVTSRLIVAGQSQHNGQKVHNLLAGVAAADPNCEVLVFVDSDARPYREWLRYLVAPLASDDPSLAATTGYRWLLPQSGGLANIILSVWNGSIATNLGPHKRNFAWGGSTAIKRRTFDELQITEAWQGTISDDYALTNAVKRAGQHIMYVPQCLVASYTDYNWAQMLEFTTRQLIITHVYSPGLWRLAWFSNLLFNLTFYFGIGLLVTRWLTNQSIVLPLLLLVVIYFLGAWKGWLRYSAIRQLLIQHRSELRRLALGYTLLPPFVALLWLYNLIMSARRHRLTWRGITYELRSPSETVILKYDNE